MEHVKSKKLFLETTVDKIFETSSTFHVKYRTTGRFQFLFFGGFLLLLTKFCEEGWALVYNSMKVWDFFDLS